jgi:hypothetical protein
VIGLAVFEGSTEVVMQFVIAALVVAVLVAERFGSPAEMHRRYFQIGLAVTLALLITGLSVLIFDVPRTGLGQPMGPGNPNTEDVLEAFRNRQTFTAGLALVLFILGVLAMARFGTLYLSLVLGGLITLFVQAFDANSNQLAPFLYVSSSQAGTTSNALYVAVLAAGAVVLLAYGYKRWERGDQQRIGNG